MSRVEWWVVCDGAGVVDVGEGVRRLLDMCACVCVVCTKKSELILWGWFLWLLVWFSVYIQGPLNI